jgi:tetratricopeptide (TPR) repeat protein
MFFEKRVYQGSSGAVYPNPVIEKIEEEKINKAYQALFLENKYLKIMILPELGGRVQMAFDKIKNRHFIYYNQVIKPALVGLTGPWISGGIEFNWPQHHRPSTFEPVDFTTSENEDGSKTVWVNEVERMFGTKGLVGFTLHPDKAYLEIKAKLFNRTALPQTFLWWANPAVKVNDDYQSIFPPDVNAVFDHGKRDVSSFPIATGTYYKVDYSPGTDISRYKNIPVPTSYMAINSAYNFMGGYEHDTRAGMLHVADHHVSPGKKQWTWGHSDFGQAWDRNLTDEDGPYIELMTGVFTDNQPDFSWLMPYEEKTFTQYFMPYRELGQVKNATKDILLSIDVLRGQAHVKVMATSPQTTCTVSLTLDGKQLFSAAAQLSPETIFEKSVALPAKFDENLLLLKVTDANCKELISYEPAQNRKNEMPKPAKPALQPTQVGTIEELFLIGQHLEQYRHATFSPVPYYKEGLRRDINDIRHNNALGCWYLRRGQFAMAEPYLRKAVATSISRNPNPYDSEPYYNLGLCLRYQGKTNDAYDAFYKATWSKAWQDTAFFSLAQIDIERQDYETALDHLDKALDRNMSNNNAWALKAAVLRITRQYEKAIDCCKSALDRDRFNLGSLFEYFLVNRGSGRIKQATLVKEEMLSLCRGNSHNLITYALDFAAAGLFAEATQLLTFAAIGGSSPMIHYHLALFAGRLNQPGQVKAQLAKAALADPYLCFPNRLEDIIALQFAMAENPKDAKASYYLGNLWYDKRQYDAAIKCWESSIKIDDQFATVQRNLGIACYNKLGDEKKALYHFEKAFALDPTDARVLMELDQLYKRLNRPASERLEFMEKHIETTVSRDDLYLERLSLYNFMGRYQQAYALLMTRRFHPWEGGEGKVSGQYVYSLTELAKQNITQGQNEKAIALLEAAQTYPHNLGEGKLFGAQENDIFYWLGIAHFQLSQPEKAREYFYKTTEGLS